LKHTYYDKLGRLKGEFYNINTPIEFFIGFIRYIDLHVDIIKIPQEKVVKVIDEDKFISAKEAGIIPPKLANKVCEIIKEYR
jgi:predicted RNA-binding protein associated with RNAse of E/G family